MIAAAKGYKAVLVMPDTMSLERRNLLRAYGADLVLTPGAEGMKGAIGKAGELAKENGWFMPQQFNNEANPEIHRFTTGPEIADALGPCRCVCFGNWNGRYDYRCRNVLKERFPDVKIIAVEPTDSPVLRVATGPHKIQGIGAGFVPEVLNTDIYDEITHGHK